MNISQNGYKHLNHIWWMLKLTYGLLFVVAGADKFMFLITHWDKYVSPLIKSFLVFPVSTFILIIGIIEVIIGLITLSPNGTRLGAYLTAIWFGLIVVNLLSFKGLFLDVAVRDIVIAIGAIALACLTKVRDDVKSSNAYL